MLSLERDARLQPTVMTDEAVEELSDVLLTQLSVRDYFDRQIYSTAARLDCIPLTEDEKIHDLHAREKVPLKPKRMIKWKNLITEK